MDKELLFELKNKSEIIADQHDGSYELMRAIVNEYRDVDESVRDYLDLNAVYLMSVGTWKHSLPNKKRVIERSHLTEESKKFLKDLLDEIQAYSFNHVYKHHETSDEGVFGMFGTGFYSFEKMTDNKSVRQFIQMCVDISEMTDDVVFYERAAQVL